MKGITGVIVGVGIALYLHNNSVCDYTNFDSPDLENSGKLMSRDTLKKFNKFLKIIGLNICPVNSGVRTVNYNSQLANAVSDSSHIYGKAIDINSALITQLTGLTQKQQTQILRSVGFDRFGIGSTFIHVDNDLSKPQHVFWGYPTASFNPFNLAA